MTMKRVASAQITDPTWKGLYRVGGVAAVLAAAIFRRNWGAEFLLLRMLGIINVGPTMAPGSAIEWFGLLQSNRLLGLILLNLVDLVNYALVGLILLALCGALRRTSSGAMAIATTIGLVGIAVYFASNQAFAMLSLSCRYAAATTDAQRSMFLAAGEALLAIDNPGAIYQGTGITISLFLVTFAGLIASIAMLRSRVFSKATAWVGMAAHVFGLGYFVALAFTPAIRAIPPSISAVFLLAWNILVARRLLRLAREC